MTLIVNIKGGGVQTGTGFLAVKEGVAVTAWHVVADAETVTARFSDGQEFEVTGLIDKDEKRDIALIRVKASDRPMLNLVAKDPEIGSKAFVVGSPEGLEFSITDGIISQIRTVDGVLQYQYSAPSNHGNSGGPVLSPNSDVLGVVSYGVTNTAGLSFAIAASNVRSLNPLLPIQPWSTIPAAPISSKQRLKLHSAFSDAMKRLWMMALLMQVDTESLLQSKVHKLDPLFTEAQIRLKVSSDVLDSALSTSDNNTWEAFHIGFFNQIIVMSLLAAEELNKCAQSVQAKQFNDEVSRFVTAFRMSEVSSDQVDDLGQEASVNVVRLMGPLLTTKVLANPIQKGWTPDDSKEVARKRFDGGYRLLSRLAFDVDSTGYVFGFLVDPTSPGRIFEVQGGTPPAKWGFRKGDFVRSVDGTKVISVEMMKQVILATKSKEGHVVVERKGKPVTLKVTFRGWA